MMTAFKLFDNPEFKDGDGGGGDEECLTISVSIRAVDNGWILTVLTEEDEEYTQVYQTNQGRELIKELAEALGVN